MSYTDGMNRATRRRAAREARCDGAPVPVPPAQQSALRREPGFMTIEHGPDRKNISCRKITEPVVDQAADTVTLNWLFRKWRAGEGELISTAGPCR